jgi:hypothetical protein
MLNIERRPMQLSACVRAEKEALKNHGDHETPSLSSRDEERAISRKPWA